LSPSLVVMGVSGSGKSTVGAALAQALGWPFLEGDSLHPPRNVAKMSAGIPLDDADRGPWLSALVSWLGQVPHGVLTCSALRRAYRDVLRAAGPLRFVHLVVPEAELARRLGVRELHFMPGSLLTSQLAALEPLEPDEDGVTLDGTLPVEELVRRVRGRA
jgi:gluconokinase